MSKMTLLALVQNILNDMDSDEVNSINDTVEAQQIAEIVKTTYEEIISDRQWPHLKTMVQLTASGTSSRPTHMSIGDDVQEVIWLKYDKATDTDTKKKYADVIWKSPAEFMLLTNARNSDESTVDVITDDSGVDVLILNNQAPTYYTSFDDINLVFDSYDSDVDSTLQTSKTQAYVYAEPSLTIADATIPNLPSKNFPYLLAEAKSVAFNALRQSPNAKEEQRSRRQRIWASREKWRNDGDLQTPDYGRHK